MLLDAERSPSFARQKRVRRERTLLSARTADDLVARGEEICKTRANTHLLRISRLHRWYSHDTVRAEAGDAGRQRVGPSRAASQAATTRSRPLSFAW